MTDPTPPRHPAEREQLQDASTLVVTVKSDHEFHDKIVNAIESLETGDRRDGTPTLSFASYEDLMGTFTPSVLELIEAIRRKKPGSINATARVVDRDVKNVHGELTHLARLGIVDFEDEGRSKRPVVWFDELIIDLPFESPNDDAARATS